MSTSDPIRVEGYAATFDRLSGPRNGNGMPLRIRPHDFDIAGRIVFACFGHNPSQQFASTYDRGLRLHQDDYGLAFSFDLPSTWAGLSLARGIRADNFRECSVMIEAPRKSVLVEEEVGTVEVIASARIAEISIVSAGLVPGTACWLSNEEAEELPPYLRGIRARWQVGRAQAALALRKRVSCPPANARAALASVRPSAAVMRQIEAILARGHSSSALGAFC